MKKYKLILVIGSNYKIEVYDFDDKKKLKEFFYEKTYILNEDNIKYFYNIEIDNCPLSFKKMIDFLRENENE